MSWELPPLGAIRVFEAAARLGSFTKAAEELGMTQSAASYQIKVLEERAGTPLFIRKTRQIALARPDSSWHRTQQGPSRPWRMHGLPRRVERPACCP
ncbi:LysR family transcriptional regulator [Mesorhizobium sp. IMUNJ 23033]|uniref:LysR family transcriptional regulator n=1 Tax=Mesorhizobium sp. IMUNJ 23033 TaxID=3378039 RepID=UPI00384C7710